MKRIVALLLTVLCIGSASPAMAAASGHRAGGAAREVTQVFHLTVEGSIAPGTTYWLAYGPLHGHFGLLQLHGVGAGTYLARRDLPLGACSTMTFVAGHGVKKSRVGRIPGAPVITVKDLGTVCISAQPVMASYSTAPIG